MMSRESWLSRWARCGLGLGLWLLVGCAIGRPHVNDRTLKEQKHLTPPDRHMTEDYRLGCPDVLELAVPRHPYLSGGRTIGPDGRIDLGDLGRLRVEGQTAAEVAGCLAGLAGVPPEQVRVRVAEFRSQQIYLFGQVHGLQRAVAYQGPETVLDLLQRVGGVTPGAAAEDVYVIRSRITEDQAPEVFHVDLRAVLSGKDPRTRLRVQPFDQVYVGETRRSFQEQYVPPCFRPLYEKFWGLYRSATPYLPWKGHSPGITGPVSAGMKPVEEGS